MSFVSSISGTGPLHSFTVTRFIPVQVGIKDLFGRMNDECKKAWRLDGSRP